MMAGDQPVPPIRRAQALHRRVEPPRRHPHPSTSLARHCMRAVVTIGTISTPGRSIGRSMKRSTSAKRA